jgi:hypothetical protein
VSLDPRGDLRGGAGPAAEAGPVLAHEVVDLVLGDEPLELGQAAGLR